MGVPSRGLTPVIENMWPHHRSMARDLVQGGLTPKQLAVLYGFTPSHITRIINAPCFKVELARLEEMAEVVTVDVRRELKEMSIVANELLDKQLHNKELNRKEQRELCFGILDRGGYGKSDKGAPTAGRDINLTQVNVGDLSDKELRDNVMDLIDGDWEEAS